MWEVKWTQNWIIPIIWHIKRYICVIFSIRYILLYHAHICSIFAHASALSRDKQFFFFYYSIDVIHHLLIYLQFVLFRFKFMTKHFMLPTPTLYHHPSFYLYPYSCQFKRGSIFVSFIYVIYLSSWKCLNTVPDTEYPLLININMKWTWRGYCTLSSG